MRTEQELLRIIRDTEEELRTCREKNLRDRVDELEETVIQLRALLTGDTENKFPTAWRLSWQESKLLSALMTAVDHYCAYERLAVVIASKNESIARATLATVLHTLRMKMGPSVVIETIPKRGLQLTKSSNAWIREQMTK